MTGAETEKEVIDLLVDKLDELSCFDSHSDDDFYRVVQN